MTQQLAIAHHNYLVSWRNYIRKNTDPLINIDSQLSELEREISIYGQAHNPRISAKSHAALNLN